MKSKGSKDELRSSGGERGGGAARPLVPRRGGGEDAARTASVFSPHAKREVPERVFARCGVAQDSDSVAELGFVGGRARMGATARRGGSSARRRAVVDEEEEEAEDDDDNDDEVTDVAAARHFAKMRRKRLEVVKARS